MSDMIFIPIADALYTNFDNGMAVNFILSGPALLSAASGLVSGFLMQMIGRKRLTIAAFAVFTVFGIVSIFVEDALVLAVLRGVSGFAYGTLNATAMAMISFYFVDEDKRGKVLGIYNATVALAGSLISFSAGFLAESYWHNALQLYWVAIPVLVFLMLSIPKAFDERENASSEAVEEGDGGKRGLGLSFFALLASYVIFNMVYMVINYESAVFFAEKNLGTSSTFGIIASLMTIGSAVMCIAFGAIFPKLKRATIVPAYLVLGLGYLVMYFSDNLFVCAAAAVLMCGSYGLSSTYFMTWAPSIVPSHLVDRAVGYLVTAACVGMFLATYLASALIAITGSETLYGIFPILAGIALVGCALSVVLTIRGNRHKQADAA